MIPCDSTVSLFFVPPVSSWLKERQALSSLFCLFVFKPHYKMHLEEKTRKGDASITQELSFFFVFAFKVFVGDIQDESSR